MMLLQKYWPYWATSMLYKLSDSRKIALHFPQILVHSCHDCVQSHPNRALNNLHACNTSGIHQQCIHAYATAIQKPQYVFLCPSQLCNQLSSCNARSWREASLCSDTATGFQKASKGYRIRSKTLTSHTFKTHECFLITPMLAISRN